MDPIPVLAAAGGGLTYQLIQIGGSLLILAGFAGARVGRLSPQSRSYIVLNLVGSVILPQPPTASVSDE